VVLGFELRVWCLLGRHSTAWVTFFFNSSYFGARVSFLPSLSWTTIFLFYASCCWDDWWAPPCLYFFIDMEWGCLTNFFCLGWPRAEIFLISASQIARIIGTNHTFGPFLSKKRNDRRQSQGPREAGNTILSKQNRTLTKKHPMISELEEIIACAHLNFRIITVWQLLYPSHSPKILFNFLLYFIYFWSTGAWTQGLHLEPLHQPCFCDAFFWDRVSQDYLPRLVLNWTSASWVARITGVSHQQLAIYLFFWDRVSLCSPADLELGPLLPLGPKCWNCRHVPPCPTSPTAFFEWRCLLYYIFQHCSFGCMWDR
jgi:hypothetical protein